MAGKNILSIPEIPLKVLKTITAGKIPFIIVGGAALALHGIPRSTLDIDIVVPAEDKAVDKLFFVAGKTGLVIRGKDIATLINRPGLLIGQWITLQDKTGIDLVDIFFEEVKEFKRLLQRSRKIRGREFSLHILSLADLERMKKVSGRPIDIADIALIKERQRSF